MGDQQDLMFACPQCGARYRWKPNYAGRKFSCKCGEVFESSPPAQDPPHDDLYDIADEPSPRRPVAAPQVAESRESPPAANTQPQAVDPIFLMARRRQPVDDENEDIKGGWIRNYLVPAILIVAALSVNATQVAWRPPDPPKPNTFTPALMGMLIVLAVVTIYTGAAMCMLLLRINWGPLGAAALKFAGMTLFATALAIPVYRMDTGDGITGITTAYGIVLLVYFATFGVFFKLELHEVAFSVVITFLVQALAAWAVAG